MTTATLKEYTLKDLAQMGKKRGIQGWHSMRKNELIRALVRDAKKSRETKSRPTAKQKSSSAKTTKSARTPARAAKSRSTATRSTSTRTASPTKATVRKAAPVAPKKAARPSVVARKIQKAQKQQEERKDLSGSAAPASAPRAEVRVAPPISLEPGKDRIVLMVRDPFWLHAHWEISTRSVQRAQAAMAEYWHTAKPVLRLMEVPDQATSGASEVYVRDIEIHGGVNNWYIDVKEPPNGFRVEIGYLASNGRFHSVARSNSVVTPEPGGRDAMDQTWVDVAQNCDRIFALSGGYSAEGSTDELQELLEERLRRPVGTSVVSKYGVGGDGESIDNEFQLKLDAELIVHGATRPGSHVTMSGEPVKLRDDGSFTVRMGLPDRRQVLPVTSSSGNGTTQQTVVLAVERNTKVMEAVVRDSNE